jgi:hypothetical protein
MFFKTLLTTGLLSGMTLAQQSPLPEAPKPQLTPRRKPAVTPKVCSVPLLNVTPLARPFMPKMKIRPEIDPKIIIPPPAPPCDDERESTPMSRRKDPKPAEQEPQVRP